MNLWKCEDCTRGSPRKTFRRTDWGSTRLDRVKRGITGCTWGVISGEYAKSDTLPQEAGASDPGPRNWCIPVHRDTIPDGQHWHCTTPPGQQKRQITKSILLNHGSSLTAKTDFLSLYSSSNWRTGLGTEIHIAFSTTSNIASQMKPQKHQTNL